MTTAAQSRANRLAPLGLSIPIPSEAALRVSLNEQERFLLLLQGLESLIGQQARVPGFNLPAYDSVGPVTYYGSTNNQHVVPYKLAGDTVATLTFTYIGGGAADDDLIETITKS